MNFIYSLNPYKKDFLIHYPYLLKLEDWLFINQFNIKKTIEFSLKYGDVFIYTTDKLIKLILDLIKVKKTKYRLLFFNIDSQFDLSENIWSDIKIHAILHNARCIKKPFLHLDLDTFILDNILENVREDIIISYPESHESIKLKHYKQYFLYFKENNIDLHKIDQGFTYNCSVLGGNNISKLEQYSAEAIDLIKTNTKIINDFPLNKFLLSSIFEQSYLTYFINKNNLSVKKIADFNYGLDIHLSNKPEEVLKKKIIHDKQYGEYCVLKGQDKKDFRVKKEKIFLNSSRVFELD